MSAEKRFLSPSLLKDDGFFAIMGSETERRNAMKTIAVIGCGRIAKHAHFPALAAMEDVRIKYACDIIEEKALAAKEKWPGIEQVITDYHIALNDPEVEAVFVLTPNDLHYTVTMDALRAGKHVLCEKPIAVNYALAKEMAEEAERQGKLLNIGVCNRHAKGVRMLRELVAEGRLGKIYHVFCSFRAYRSIPGLGGAFTTKVQSGGGVLIDWGIHLLDLILYILGNPSLTTVTCDTYSEMAKDMKTYRYKTMWAEDTADIEGGTNDVDDFVSGYVRTSGPSISLTGAWAQNIGHQEMFVDFLGDRAGVRFDYGKKSFTFFDGETLEATEPDCVGQNAYVSEDRAFLDAIDSGVTDSNHISLVLESAKLIDALYESAEAGKEISFS